jgi:hypothetical protein
MRAIAAVAALGVLLVACDTGSAGSGATPGFASSVRALVAAPDAADQPGRRR